MDYKSRQLARKDRTEVAQRRASVDGGGHCRGSYNKHVVSPPIWSDSFGGGGAPDEQEQHPEEDRRPTSSQASIDLLLTGDLLRQHHRLVQQSVRGGRHRRSYSEAAVAVRQQQDQDPQPSHIGGHASLPNVAQHLILEAEDMARVLSTVASVPISSTRSSIAAIVEGGGGCDDDDDDCGFGNCFVGTSRTNAGTNGTNTTTTTASSGSGSGGGSDSCTSTDKDGAGTTNLTGSIGHGGSMYGDLINGLSHAIFIPTYVWNCYSDPSARGAVPVTILWSLTALLCWFSWWKQRAPNDNTSTRLSLLAASVQSLDSICMNLHQWPYNGELLILPQFLWALLVVSGNTAVPLGIKASVAMMALSASCVISVYSPLTTLSQDLPTLLGITAVFLVFHHYHDTRIPGEGDRDTKLLGLLTTQQGGMIVLAGIFSYHLASECAKLSVNPGYAVEGGLSMVKAGMFTLLGFISSGALRQQVDAKRALETLVQQRTRAIAQQAEQLRMVGMALEASETGIAVADSERRVLWSNSSLRRRMKSDYYSSTTDAVDILESLDMDEDNREKFRKCFHPHNEHCHCHDHGQRTTTATAGGGRKAELVVKERVFDVEISPVAPSSNPLALDGSSVEGEVEGGGVRFLVVFKDITEHRARERAEMAAERESVQKRAMSESIETLSHELRTPLQGIMGMTSILLDNDGDDNRHSREEAREMMLMVMASSRLLLTLINNILDVRKCDAEMMNQFTLSPIPLASSMKECSNFCRPVAAISDVDVALTLAEPPPQSSLLLTDEAGITGDIVADACPAATETGRVYVQSNPVRFQQVMINLVSNAIKYTPQGSTIWLRTEVMTREAADREIRNALAVGLPHKVNASSSSSELEEEPRRENDDAPTDGNRHDYTHVAVISVCDSGSGIPEKMASRLFSRFHQCHQKTSGTVGGNKVAQPSGTGLGLNLCLKFVDRMHGNIWVNNDPNTGGACFSFCLPVVRTLTNDEGGMMGNPQNGCPVRAASSRLLLPNSDSFKARRRRSNRRRSSVTTDGGGASITEFSPPPEHVLVVDDTLINLKVMGKMLKRAGVPHVTTVDSGLKALATLDRTEFDLVITDLQMPEMSGTELSAAIQHREVEARPVDGGGDDDDDHCIHVPVVVGLTAETGESVDERCKASGMAHVLHKPITSKQMDDFLKRTFPKLERRHILI